MLPFTLSDIPWWGWLVVAALIYLLARYFIALFEKDTFSANSGERKDVVEVGYRLVTFTLSLVAALCAIIGIVKLVKWVWYR